MATLKLAAYSACQAPKVNLTHSPGRNGMIYFASMRNRNRLPKKDALWTLQAAHNVTEYIADNVESRLTQAKELVTSKKFKRNTEQAFGLGYLLALEQTIDLLEEIMKASDQPQETYATDRPVHQA